MSEEWKLIWSEPGSGRGRRRLYRWREDPLESRDLAAERPITLAVLSRMLEERLENPGARFEGGEAEFTPEVERQLRALGYLQ